MTYTWSIPAGKEITGTTYIKDTDNNISDTINNLVDFVNGEGVHLNQGLTFDLVDKSSAQTIAGIKTHTAQIRGITPIAAADLARKDYVDGLSATKAPLASPTFTGTPTAPTPTSDMQVSTKKYVDDGLSNKITLATANSYDLGVGQTWQNVTASRSYDVTYTNTTGKPIQVNSWVIASSVTYIALNIDSVLVATQQVPTGGYYGWVSGIVPPNVTYKFTRANTAQNYIAFYELR